MFNENLILSEYDAMVAAAEEKEIKWMQLLQKHIGKKGAVPATSPLLTTNNPDEFFELLLHPQGGEYASVNANQRSYDIMHNGQVISSKTVTNNSYLNQKFNQGDYAAVAGLLYEDAGKEITEHIIGNLTNQNITSFGNLVGVFTGRMPNSYYGDYTIEIVEEIPPSFPYIFPTIDQTTIPIEEKANINDFHVANPKNRGILGNLTDVQHYMSTNGSASLYDYLALKLVKEKIKDYYPIFRSVSNSNGGVLTSSTILSTPGHLQLRGYQYPTQQQIHQMALAIAPTLGLNSDPAVRDIIAHAEAKQQLSQTLLTHVLQQASTNSGIRNIELWYIR